MANIYNVNGNIIDICGDDGFVIHVGTGQEYSTLRSGIAEAILHKGATVIVHSGVYDLTSEFAAEISAASGSSQIGIELGNDVNVIFNSGAYVKALFPTSSTWIDTYFSPFYGKNFTLDGLNIEASNCRYCIHDEQNGENVQYHNTYKNCIMKMTADPSSGYTNGHPQCIGGGLGKYGVIDIDGGSYYSEGTDLITGECPCISYHNGSTAGCDSRIFIRDVYLDGDDGNLRFGYYGASTIQTMVYVSGCSMGSAILKRAETSSSHNDNMTITEWNNAIRA